MMLVWKDRVRQAVAAGGTGALTLGAAVAGHQALAASEDGAVVAYVIEDGAAWETGLGTYTHGSTSLARTTRTASSTGAALNVSTSATVFLDWTAAAIADFGPPWRGTGTYAAMQSLTGPAAGQEYTVTDLGPARSRWHYDGTRWRPNGGRVILRNIPAAVTGVAQLAEQILDSFAIPANLLAKDGDIIFAMYALEKSAATETLQVRFRIGTAGSTADTQLVGTSPLSTARSFGSNKAFQRGGATTLFPIGTVGSTGTASGPTSFAGSTGTAQTAAITLASSLTTAQQLFSLSVSLSAGAEVPKLQSYIVEFIAA